MSSSKVARRRHVPVKGAPGVYKSQRASGWVYEVRHPGKARRHETVGTRLDQAKARAREVHGAPVQIASVATRLDEVVADWRRTRTMRASSERRLDGIYRQHIEQALGHRKVREIDARAIQAWLNGLKRQDGRAEELSSGTKRMALSTLNIILGHAVEMSVIGTVPRIPRRAKPKLGEPRKRILLADEEERLLAYCVRLGLGLPHLSSMKAR